MDSFDIDGVRYTWDPEKRILHNTFAPGTLATRVKGITVVRNIKKWVEPDSGPYAFIVDGSGAQEIDAGYRKEFASLFVDRPGAVLAVFGFPAAIEMIPVLFGIATGVNLKAFHDEKQARAWLRERGFDA